MTPYATPLLVALFAGASLAGETATVPTESRPASRLAVMPMTVNEVDKGDASILIEGDDVLLRASDLETAGAGSLAGVRRLIGGQAFVSLRSLAPQVTWTIDETNLQLALRIDPTLLGRSERSLADGRPDGILYATGSSAFLNYAVSLNDSGVATGFAEAGWSLRGNLLYGALARTESGRFVRGPTKLMIDDRSRLTRWTVGDAVPALVNGPLIGGVSISRQFSLDPYFDSLPGVDLSGVALSPSRADVFMNGQLVRQVQIPPGPFDMRSIPVNAGSGAVPIALRDAPGGQRTLSSHYYLTPRLLAAGLSEYSYSLGFRREQLASESFDYGEPVFIGAHRRGLSDHFTAGARAEAAKRLLSAGCSATANYGFGDLEMTGAISRSSQSNGWTASLAYSFVGRGVNASVYYGRTSRLYVTTTLPATADRLTSDANAAIGMSLGRVAVSLQYGFFEDRDQGSGSRASARVSANLGQKLRLQVFAGHTRLAGRPHVNSVQASLLYVLGRLRSATTSWNSGKGASVASADLVQSLPKGVGLGYRLHATAQGTDLAGQGLLQYQGSKGLYEARYTRSGQAGAGSVSLSGGLVAIGGGLHFTRAVRDGFALIRLPKVAGVRTYASNQEAGVTDDSGTVLVPDLIPYYGNQLSIADQDVPMDYEIAAVRRLVAPPYRGGAVVDFPLRRLHAFHGAVMLSLHGEEIAPAFGALRLSVQGRVFESPIGARGDYYLENVPAGTHRLEVHYKGTICPVSLTFPEAAEPIVRLPTLRCNADTPAPAAAAPGMPVPPESGSQDRP